MRYDHYIASICSFSRAKLLQLVILQSISLGESAHVAEHLFSTSAAASMMMAALMPI